MSARDELNREMASLPESVAQRLLDYLHSLPPQNADVPAGDYFESYWSRWFGCLADEPWEEAADLPFENREAW